MLMPIFALLSGLALLVWSADRFVEGGAATARNLGMSPVLIGLTIVALGTSAPEMIVSANAAIKGSPDMGVGNAIGSNIANLGLVLGVTALIAAIPIKRDLLFRDYPIYLLVTLCAGAFLWDGLLTVVEGVLLLSGTLVIIGILIYSKTHDGDIAEIEAEYEEEIDIMTPVRAWSWLFIGLTCLLISANILVWGAKELALSFGVSPLVVGLTVVALGTSLPELAASVASALKGHMDIALGNVIGSNILNLLGVMGLPPLFAHTQLGSEVLTRDFAVMGCMTGFLAVVIYWRHWRAQQQTFALGRIIGCSLLFGYFAYYVLIFTSLS